MKENKTIGLDLAKNVFHLIGWDQRSKEVTKRKLKRNQVPAFFANLSRCLIGMEACAGAHDWARKFQEYGHEVRLISPQYVKAYVHGNKNDYNDASAVPENRR